MLLYDFKRTKKRLQSHILEDPEFIKAQQIIVNQIYQSDRLEKTPPKKRPTLVQRAKKITKRMGRKKKIRKRFNKTTR